MKGEGFKRAKVQKGRKIRKDDEENQKVSEDSARATFKRHEKIRALVQKGEEFKRARGSKGRRRFKRARIQTGEDSKAGFKPGEDSRAKMQQGRRKIQ